MQHLTNHHLFKHGEQREDTDCESSSGHFIKKKICNPSSLEAKKILIRRAITRARGKSPLMKFPVDHMQFVSSQ